VFSAKANVKITITASAIVVFCGTLFGAEPSSDGSSSDLWVSVCSYDMPGEREFLDRLAADFAGKEKGIRVRIDLETWNDAHERIARWIAGGKGPDVVVVPDIWLVEFAHGIEPFDPFAPADLRRQFFPVLLNKGIYKGKLLGLVWATSTKALFYRKDLFDKAGLKPPTTWKEMLEAAIKLNDPPKVYGIGLPGKREYETDDNFYFYLWSAGGRFFDEHGKSAINSEAGVKALQFYVDLINQYHVTQPEVTSWSRKKTRGLFEAGKLAMFATGPWAIESLRKNAPDIAFGVVPFPVDKVPMTQLITDHIVILKGSKRKALAGRFIRFAYRDKYRLEYTKLGLVPEKITVAADEYFRKDPDWKVFIDVIPHGRSVPLIRWEKIGIATREAMYQAITGRKTPKQALDELAETINEITAEQKRQ